MARLPRSLLAALLFAPALVLAQVQDPVVQVRGLAPQLVAFAGSEANFQNLVNGLAQGTPVSLVAVTADGLRQTVTFTPTGALAALQIAQTLEQARQSLITRGVAAPTPEQIGIALLGGRLTTPAGTTSVAGLLASAQGAGSASTGASVAPAASNLQVDVRPVAPAANTVAIGTVQPPTMTSASPRPGNTSDTPVSRNTSNTPFGGNASNLPVPPVSVPAAPTTSGVTNTSPAAQMQGRR